LDQFCSAMPNKAIPSIKISGATDSYVNGLWLHSGTKNGKPRFTNERNLSACIEWTGSQWDMKGSAGPYPGPTTGELPPECNGMSTRWGTYVFRLSHVPGSSAIGYVDQLTARLHKNRKFADVTIQCGSESIQVHSCVLADSPVFDRMLETPMLEASTKIIKIEDFSWETVNQFVEILYTGKCSSACSWGDVLRMADKYQLLDLIPVCIHHMQETLSAETVVPYLRALNRTLHLPECQDAKELIISHAHKHPELVRAMANTF